MKILAFNDLHLASAAPESRTDEDFPEELFELLDQIERLALHLQVRAIVIAGDLFHVRSRCANEMLRRLGTWCMRLKSAGIRIVAIPGNHDLKHDRYETLGQQVLGLFFEFGLMENVSVTRGCEAVYLDTDDPSGRATETVIIYGVPFPDAFDLAKWEEAGQRVAAAHPVPVTRIVLGHCFANTHAGDYWGEPVHSYSALLAASQADVLVLGHDHTDRGAFKLGEKLVVDLGAVSRGSISIDDIERDIKIAIIETTTQTVQQVRLAYRPAAAIFDLTKKAVLQQERKQVETFVQQLAADLLTQGADPTLSFEDRLRAMVLPREVLQRTLAYIDAAESG